MEEWSDGRTTHFPTLQLSRTPFPSDSAAPKFSPANAGGAIDFGQIRIPRQILFACLGLRFRYPCHYYG
jgi:hypothetical protein